MRRIFQNLLAAILGGLIWVGFISWQLKAYSPTWQVLVYAFGFGFCLVILSTSIVGVFIKEQKCNNHLEVEILKAGD
jgi:hypothetical protein